MPHPVIFWTPPGMINPTLPQKALRALGNSFSEKIFPNVQLADPLAQLEAISLLFSLLPRASFTVYFTDLNSNYEFFTVGIIFLLCVLPVLHYNGPLNFALHSNTWEQNAPNRSLNSIKNEIMNVGKSFTISLWMNYTEFMFFSKYANK